MCLLQFKYDKSYNKLNTPTAYITYNIFSKLEINTKYLHIKNLFNMNTFFEK